MSDQPISLSRADRRKFEKAMRRAPRASRQKPSRADLPLRLIPWNIHGVWAPIDRILAKLEIDGTAEYSGGEPVLYDPGTNDWHNSAQDIRGIAEFYDVAARSRNNSRSVFCPPRSTCFTDWLNWSIRRPIWMSISRCCS